MLPQVTIDQSWNSVGTRDGTELPLVVGTEVALVDHHQWSLSEVSVSLQWPSGHHAGDTLEQKCENVSFVVRVLAFQWCSTVFPETLYFGVSVSVFNILLINETYINMWSKIE